MNRSAAALVCTLCVAAGAARAQTPPIEDIEANTVEELVIRGRLPGPAWWRVSDADSTVYILGVPDVLPKGLAWNRSVLNRRLAGANGLITPPIIQASDSLLAVPKLLLSMRSAVNSKTPLDQTLSPALRVRLAQAAARAGKSSRDFQSLRPWYAGVRLAQRYRNHVGLEGEGPIRTIEKAAREGGLKSRPAYTVDAKASALLQEIKTATDDRGRTCLEAAVDEIEAGDAAIRASAEAWAAGDVRVALGAPRSSEICLAALPGAGALKRDSLARQADAIDAALRAPGHTVAVLRLRSIVAEDGVLERLRARGRTVHAPE